MRDPLDNFDLDRTLHNDDWPLGRFLACYLIGWVDRRLLSGLGFWFSTI